MRQNALCSLATGTIIIVSRQLQTYWWVQRDS